MITKLAKRILLKLGYSITRINKSDLSESNSSTLSAAFSRLKNIGIDPTHIIDVGAAEGTWSLRALPFFPFSNYLLIEPLKERITNIEQMKNKFSNLIIINKCLGNENGNVTLSIYEDLDGSGIGINESDKIIEKRNVAVVTLDSIFSEFKINGNVLLKLDTHGFEIPIFEGALNSFPFITTIIVEVYGFKISNGSLFFWQICDVLQKYGFRLFDIIDILRRENDKAFWQCDMVFIKNNSQVFNSDSYN